MHSDICRRQNDVAAAMLSVVEVSFGVLPPFVVMFAWEGFNKAAIDEEAGEGTANFRQPTRIATALHSAMTATSEPEALTRLLHARMRRSIAGESPISPTSGLR